jgi:hypothetical protein
MTSHATDPFTGVQIRIGVMGSAGGVTSWLWAAMISSHNSRSSSWTAFTDHRSLESACRTCCCGPFGALKRQASDLCAQTMK